jgi:hypothetical protein
VSTATALRLRKKRFGERGPGELEGERANRGTFQVAGDKAELTGATDTEAGSTATVERRRNHGERQNFLGTRAGRECSAKGTNEQGSGRARCGLKRG